jgi:hypothetical protein
MITTAIIAPVYTIRAAITLRNNSGQELWDILKTGLPGGSPAIFN